MTPAETPQLPLEFMRAMALGRLRLDCATAIMANGSNADRESKREAAEALYQWVVQGLAKDLGLATSDTSRKRA